MKQEKINVTIRFLGGGIYNCRIDHQVNDLLNSGAKSRNCKKNDYVKELIRNHLIRTRKIKTTSFNIETTMLIDMKEWWQKEKGEKSKTKKPNISGYFNMIFKSYFGQGKNEQNKKKV